MPKSIGIYTLGCRVSQYESDAIAELLQKKGYEIKPASEICDAYIINTCTVTAESGRKSRQIIRRLIRKNPNAYIVVMGCESQIEPDVISKINGVDYVLGTDNKKKSAELLQALFEKNHKNGSAENLVTSLDGTCFESMFLSAPGRSRAFIKIEDGCNNKCSYCIISTARGKARSKPFCDVVNEAETLAKLGYCEIVLTGIETSAYCYGLTELINRISEIKGIERIRLGSLDPSFTNKKFIDAIADNPKLMPHFHLSVQSGCSDTLARMKRRYNADIALKNINYIKERIPNVMFSADFITGFPLETEENYLETEEFVSKIKFLHLHVFPYSERKGTEAAEIKPQIPENIRNERARRLIALGEKLHDEQLTEILKRGAAEYIVAEESDEEYTSGHLPCFAEIYVKGNFKNGELIKVTPTELKEGKLYGIKSND